MATAETLWISAAPNVKQLCIVADNLPMVTWQNCSLDMSVRETVAAASNSLIFGNKENIFENTEKNFLSIYLLVATFLDFWVPYKIDDSPQKGGGSGLAMNVLWKKFLVLRKIFQHSQKSFQFSRKSF